MKAVTVLKVVICLLVLAGLVLMATLPVNYPRYAQIESFARIARSDSGPLVMGILLLMGALGLWICGELLYMLHTIKSNPFVMRNANGLRRIGWVAMAVMALALLIGVPGRDLLMLLCAGALAVLGLFAMTLSQLFRQAVRFKEENDLTI